MPFYKFHSADGVNPPGDDDRRELPSFEAALREAQDAASEALLEDVTRGAKSVRVVVTLKGEDGVKLATVEMQAETKLFSVS